MEIVQRIRSSRTCIECNVAINRLTGARTHTYCRIQCGTRRYSLLFRASLLHLDPDPTVRIDCDHRFDPNLFDGLPSWTRGPHGWRLSLRIRVHVQRHPLEGLSDASNYRGHFVVCELLSETNPRSSVEWKEDEGIGNEVLLDSFIQEPVGIEIFRCRGLDY